MKFLQLIDVVVAAVVVKFDDSLNSLSVNTLLSLQFYLYAISPFIIQASIVKGLTYYFTLKLLLQFKYICLFAGWEASIYWRRGDFVYFVSALVISV